MKNMIIAATLFSLVPGVVQAGSTYDSCVKEEKNLKAREADDCSGIKYLLNPSGCFATRKKVKEFAAGPCGEIIKTGKPETVAPPAMVPVATKRTNTPAPVTSPAPASVEAPNKVVSQSAARTESPAPHTAVTIEQLTEENARLRAEIGRLKMENEKLRNR